MICSHSGGTAVSPVTPCLATKRGMSAATRWLCSTTCAPTAKAVVIWLKPASKLSGSADRMTSSAVLRRYELTLSAPTIRLRWLSTTPLGRPVLPDV